ncbi:DUF732 domain-containing protein [Corynebacterium sp.]|uniref:DUF732 domain-containing protein n=1 Tax=Corynebacterium sp. TaxID=1720 RepID=UPI0026DB87BB|nr:DUF732 domain-containing protein [Corynebacterium sp.]MDO5076729.1 DUF732 domain-containing protein [Corynebacterium sp.]
MSIRHAFVVLVACSALVACGGATSEDTTDSSATSLSRATTASSGATSKTDTPSDASSTEPSVKDRPAQEISSLPEITPERTATDEDFLHDLQDKKVKVEGVEDQLIAAATEVCRANELGQKSFTVDAVAGQLIEQGRSSETPEALAETIAAAAKNAYC